MAAWILIALSVDIHPHISGSMRIMHIISGSPGSFRYSDALHEFLNCLSAGQQVNISDLSSGKDELLNDDLLSVAATLARWGAL
ncbi:hypothetical protein ACLKMY_07535 [Paraburkholderia mimosarum]|uniref:hypothetical protein n=1 Tax=Paraburkholderia mimosarum TaxID=312026 RepID=UPI0039C0FA58